MNITDVRVRLMETESKMKGVASITIDDAFAVHDIKIIENENGLFVVMPSRKSSDGQFRDIAHPINTETRNLISQLVLGKYKETKASEETTEM